MRANVVGPVVTCDVPGCGDAASGPLVPWCGRRASMCTRHKLESIRGVVIVVGDETLKKRIAAVDAAIAKGTVDATNRDGVVDGRRVDDRRHD
jgi:hypothetical protein